MKIILQYLLPKCLLSQLVGKLSRITLPWFKNWIIRLYCQHYKIDLSEAVEENYRNYRHFNDFFTRPLKPESRAISTALNTLISPVDGVIYQMGRLDNQQLINAKGRGFTAEDLLGNSAEADYFRNGDFIVIYLSPANYHRVHMPIPGKISHMRYIPGKLFSVNPGVTDYLPQIFAKNERAIIHLDCAPAKIALIMVGAMIVGSIETTWEGIVNAKIGRPQLRNWDYTQQKLIFNKGEELGRFNLGSTIIMLLPAGSTNWSLTLHEGMPIQMGMTIASLGS